MDPLSDVLSLVRPTSYQFRGFEAGGDWSVQFGQKEGIKCYAVVSGTCWLSMEGVGDALRLTSGDCVLLPLGRPFRLASDLALASTDALSIFSTPNGGLACINGGGDFSGVGGYFALSGTTAAILLSVLAPIVHIRNDSDKAALRWCMDRIRAELRDGRHGGHLVLQHLAQMMLVEALRVHLDDGARGSVGWLFALTDKQIGSAIRAMHDDPAHRWTLQALAQHVGMSRSIFAMRFKETVGSTPMDYLTRWCMLVAGDRLANSSDSLSAIALALGYESESAFSTAFKRVMGCSPRQYGRGWNPPIPSTKPMDTSLAQRPSLAN